MKKFPLKLFIILIPNVCSIMGITKNNTKCVSNLNMSRNYLLAGDIGGTYSRLALYLGPSDESQDVTEAKYKDALCMKEYLNAGYVTNYGSDGFNHILNEFLKLCFSNDENECSNCAIVACIACAGPIRKNALEFTKDANLQFVIRGDDIRDSEDGYKKLIKVGRKICAILLSQSPFDYILISFVVCPRAAEL